MGYNLQLCRGFKELGHQAQLFDLFEHPFNYQAQQEAPGWIVLQLRRCIHHLRLPPEQRSRLVHLVYHLLKLLLFLWAICCFDTFIFAGRRSFYGLRELGLLKRLGKRVIFVFFGTDTRPPYLNGVWLTHSSAALAELTLQYAHDLRQIENHADVMVNHPPSAQLQRRTFVQWYAIGIPFATPTVLQADLQPDPPRDRSGTVRILHAPSRADIKGTSRIETVVRDLQSRGYDLELQVIRNQPNHEVLRALQTCDLVIDELYSDALMAKFATEAAFFGKPVLVAGYLGPEELDAIPEALRPPVRYVRPEDFETALIDLLEQPESRLELGRQAQAFVLEQWAPSQVARRYLRLIEADIPADWLADPAEIRYGYGFGMTLPQLQEHLRVYLAEQGEAALQLEDKPALKARLLEIAG